MLNSVYDQKIGDLSDATKHLTEAQISLLDVIKSKSRFEQLMDVLPDGWEKYFKIKVYDNPNTAAKAFIMQKTIRPNKVIYERLILDVVVSDKHEAVPGKYDEYLKRDNDYPEQWKVYQGLTEFVKPSFHVDHKLIWTTKERSIDPDSDLLISDVDFSYCINIYIPNLDTLSNVESMKINNLV